MRWNKIVAICMTLLALAFSSLIIPGKVDAQKPTFFQHLYLLKDAKLYNGKSTAKKTVATLVAGQVLTIVETDQTSFLDKAADWYQVKTWLGNKWIKAEEGMLYTGNYSKTDQTITTVFDAELYDYPGATAAVDKVAPGKLHAVSLFNYRPPSASNANDLIIMNDEHWYRIDTAAGKKWIRNPAFLESVKKTPLAKKIKLTGTEISYPIPFVVESKAEKIEPQIVQIVGEWKVGLGPNEINWLKIRLPEGDRWFIPKQPIIDDYQELNESLTLQSETRYFEQLQDGNQRNGKTNWLKPGTYEAFESSGDFVHIRTELGEVWVNPKRALLERPLGIIPTDERIRLTKTSSYYVFPATGEISHQTGFYSPQAVLAFEKWISPSGTVYYHFRSFAGDEWVTL
ncbi:hypothetical protein [Cohnella soli]|uniref:SH3 domain-containing protein n=1 Tax=Cohnella soli TaxID=425005 RepID=A0ABW0HS00_9BACL